MALLAAVIVCLCAAPLAGTKAAEASAAKAAKVTSATVGRPAPRANEAIASSLASPIDVFAAEAEGVSRAVLEMALAAIGCAVRVGDIDAPPTLTLIDYSKPSVEPRLWVFDMKSGQMVFKELVAHGRNTGENMAMHFSDEMNSHQSSLGLFVTGDTYEGSNGYSLRLDGLEAGFNARARQRAIVMHGAPYVNPDVAATQGRLGRSWGCPALREAVAHQIIDTIRGGGVIFSYYPDSAWMSRSRFINCGSSPSVATH